MPDLLPELPLLILVAVLALAVRAVRRAIAAIVLIALALFVASAVLHWPRPALADLPQWWTTPATLAE